MRVLARAYRVHVWVILWLTTILSWPNEFWRKFPSFTCLHTAGDIVQLTKVRSVSPPSWEMGTERRFDWAWLQLSIDLCFYYPVTISAQKWMLTCERFLTDDEHRTIMQTKCFFCKITKASLLEKDPRSNVAWLMQDQKPNRPDEKKRIQNAGGTLYPHFACLNHIATANFCVYVCQVVCVRICMTKTGYLFAQYLQVP